jgi:nucleolin
MKEEMKEMGSVTKVEWLSHSDTGRFRGAGFLTFASDAEASAALALNGKELEGRPMKVELATPRKAPASGGFGNGASDPGEPSESIFLGNLSWSITEDAVRAAFKECGEIARIKWLEKDGEFRGIAFVDFETVEAATKAVALAGSDIAGRPCRINFSKSKGGGGGGGDKWGGAGGKPARQERPYKPEGPKPEGCVELFCGNLSYSIDEAKVKTFFGAAGANVTDVRWLNDKESGEFKGIGFVSFADSSEVDKALSLAGENLDGRPIRLDYAGQKPKKEGAWQGGW